MRTLVLPLSRQRLRQQRLELMESSLQQVPLHYTRVDEAAEHGCLLEQAVEALHSALELVVIAGKRNPVGFARVWCEAGAGQVHRRQDAVLIHAPPRGQRQVESGDLCTARIKLEPV